MDDVVVIWQKLHRRHQPAWRRGLRASGIQVLITATLWLASLHAIWDKIQKASWLIYSTLVTKNARFNLPPCRHSDRGPEPLASTGSSSTRG